MRYKFYANQLIKKLKELGYKTFTIDDLRASGFDYNSSLLVSARQNGLIRKLSYNPTTRTQRWEIL